MEPTTWPTWFTVTCLLAGAALLYWAIAGMLRDRRRFRTAAPDTPSDAAELEHLLAQDPPDTSRLARMRWDGPNLHTPILKCERCEKSHDELVFMPLAIPTRHHETGELVATHWATCPLTRSPITIVVLGLQPLPDGAAVVDTL